MCVYQCLKGTEASLKIPCSPLFPFRNPHPGERRAPQGADAIVQKREGFPMIAVKYVRNSQHFLGSGSLCKQLKQAVLTHAECVGFAVALLVRCVWPASFSSPSLICWFFKRDAFMNKPQASRKPAVLLCSHSFKWSFLSWKQSLESVVLQTQTQSSDPGCPEGVAQSHPFYQITGP